MKSAMKNARENPLDVRLIGVSGLAQHGKDTVAQFLIDEYGYKRFAFADRLKQLAIELNPQLVREFNSAPPLPWRRIAGDFYYTTLAGLVDVKGWDEAKGLQEVRRFLQELGTRCRDTFGDNVWIEALYDDLYEYSETCRRRPLEPGSFAPGVVISDVRFPNEVDFIRREGGIVILVQRVNKDGSPFDNGVGVDHISESGVQLIGPDFQVQASSRQQLVLLVRDLLHDEIGG